MNPDTPVRRRRRAGPGIDRETIAGRRPLSARSRARLIGELALRFGRPVDLVDLNIVAVWVLRQALVRGRLLFNRDPTVYAVVMRRMLFDEADFMPLRRRVVRRPWEAMIHGS